MPLNADAFLPHLRNVIIKWPKRYDCYADCNQSQLCQITNKVGDTFRLSHAIEFQQVDNVNGTDVDENVLHIQQDGEVECGLQILLAQYLRYADQHNAEQDAIVLEMNMIDDQQTEIPE